MEATQPGPRDVQPTTPPIGIVRDLDEPPLSDPPAVVPAPPPGADPFPEPGAQGIATQDDDDEPAPPDPAELKLADEVYADLEAGKMSGAQAVVDALIALVDIHPTFRTPELFGSSDDRAEKYAPAHVVQEIARWLARGCGKLDAKTGLLVCYFRDHQKWTKNGQKVHGIVKVFDGFLQHHLDGMMGAIIVNYHLWRTFNPRQKVFTVYHLLRQVDGDGRSRAPDWVGFFEEPDLFGAGVHEEMVAMAKAFVRDAPKHADDVHQLSILAGVFD